MMIRVIDGVGSRIGCVVRGRWCKSGSLGGKVGSVLWGGGCWVFGGTGMCSVDGLESRN